MEQLWGNLGPFLKKDNNSEKSSKKTQDLRKDMSEKEKEGIIRKEVLFRQKYDFILEEVLTMMKKQIAEICNHHKFFQMIPKEDKDMILGDLLSIIRSGMESFWNSLYKFYLYEEKGDSQSREYYILMILEEYYEYLKNRIEQLWKLYNDYYTNNKEFNEEIRRKKDLIFQDHCEMIRRGMELLWESLDEYLAENNNL